MKKIYKAKCARRKKVLPKVDKKGKKITKSKVP